MRDGSHSQTVAIVTTSWDDGHPLDQRVADILGSYGVRGTFYVPIQYAEMPRMTDAQLRQLAGTGMEIGSHTVTHARLSRFGRERILYELRESKRILEHVLGVAVPAFCYPEGKFSRVARACAVEAGYQLARTTMAFHPETTIDPFQMPVFFQFFPHTRSVHVRHAVKEGNLSGLLNWHRLWGRENNLDFLTQIALDHIVCHGGILHIWGHSWELEEYHLWDSFTRVIKCIAQHPDVLYLTNTQVARLVTL